jgi:uncharacterized protein (TIGR00730 family)
MTIQSIAVYCGSSAGNKPIYSEAAIALGAALAHANMELVYGGGSIGLMGKMADSCLNHEGRVRGVITQALKSRELCHTDLTELHVVDTMHERKQMMAAYADAFIVMPGGIGTLEEFFEVYTWLQLRIHDKPVGLLNIAGYYDHLATFLEHSVKSGFLNQAHFDELLIAKDIDVLLGLIRSFQPGKVDKLAP